MKCNIILFLHTDPKSCRTQLGQLLQRQTALLECSSFIFVPGPTDILGGSGKLLPRLPFPEAVTGDLARRVPACVFTSNPCRIKVYSREVVLFREDICSKLRKCSRRPKEGDTALHMHALRTLLSQSHLCPLPLEVAPINWEYDHALRLYPLPHALLLGGRGTGFVATEKGVRAANPGCFGADFSFVVYRPISSASGEQSAHGEPEEELELYALDAEEVDRETVAERARDERPRKRRRRTTAALAAPVVEGAAAVAAPVAGHKTPKDRQPPRRRRETPNAARAAVAPLPDGQRGIGGYFMSRLDGPRADPPLLGRRRRTRAVDSDDDGSAASDEDRGIVDGAGDEAVGEEGYGEDGRNSGSDDGRAVSEEEDADSEVENESAIVRGGKSAAAVRSRRVLQEEDSDTE